MKPFPCTALFVLALFALAQAQPLSAPAPAPSAATSSCVLTPELTEGPYWLDDELLRTNITEGQAGIPFNLSITVKDITSCLPVANAFVDIWHCNATGAYSGFGGNSGAGQGGPDGMGGSGPSTNETFLRGIAVTDSSGVATFETIQPGWYQGRTPHIHIKVHIPTNTSTTEIDEYASSHTVHTGQMFFTDAHMTLVSAVSPYTENPATRLALTADSIYNNDAAEVLNVTQVSADSIAAGLVANIEAIVDTTAVYTPASTASNVVATSSPSSTLAATPGSTVQQSAPVSAVTSAVAPTTAVPPPPGSAMGANPIDIKRVCVLVSAVLLAAACF